MIIPNVFAAMNNSECFGESIANADEFRVRINVEFLNGCEFDCAGCFVKRKSAYTDSDMNVLVDTVEKFRKSGYTFDEIILGATDFFGAYNSLEVIQDERFSKLFESGDVVLTLLSTLQSTERYIVETIQEFNNALPYEGLEVEVLIPVDVEKLHDYDLGYINLLKDKIELLQLFDAKVDYALQLNIRDLDKEMENFDIVAITRLVREEFGTILEFNPSFMRSGNIGNVLNTLDKWNAILERNLNESNKNDVTLTISNKYHAGNNERTFTFKNGVLYTTPFIYENVVSLKPEFAITKTDEFYSIDDINDFDVNCNISQYQYMSNTDECEDCQHVASCVSKLVLRYMEVNGIKKCLLSKPSIELYDN